MSDDVETLSDITVGIDLAKWQWGRPIPWKGLRERGVRFVIHKATHGDFGTDPNFVEGFKQAREEGFIRGAYFWFLPDRDARAQARRALDVVGPYLQKDDLPMSLDHEDPTTKLRDQAIVDKLEECIDEFEERGCFEKRVQVYTGNWFTDLTSKKTLSTKVGSRALWLSCYPRIGVGNDQYVQAAKLAAKMAPVVPVFWREMGLRETFFQFDGDGGLLMPNGMDADFNIFRGSEDALVAYSHEALIVRPDNRLLVVKPDEEVALDERMVALRAQVLSSLTVDGNSFELISEAISRDTRASNMNAARSLLTDTALHAMLSKSAA